MRFEACPDCTGSKERCTQIALVPTVLGTCSYCDCHAKLAFTQATRFRTLCIFFTSGMFRICLDCLCQSLQDAGSGLVVPPSKMSSPIFVAPYQITAGLVSFGALSF